MPTAAAVRRSLPGALLFALLLVVAAGRPAVAQDEELLTLLTVAASEGDLNQAEARTV